MIDDLVRNARAAVLYLYSDGGGSCPGPHDEPSAPTGVDYRLLPVDDQVQNHLLEPMRVGDHERKRGIQLADQFNALSSELVTAER